MKVALLGAKCLPSAGSINHAVVPFVGLPDASTQSNAAPPHAWTSIPRCCLYQARSATGSFALKKIPPIPVTLFILSLRSATKLERAAFYDAYLIIRLGSIFRLKLPGIASHFKLFVL